MHAYMQVAVLSKWSEGSGQGVSERERANAAVCSVVSVVSWAQNGCVRVVSESPSVVAPSGLDGWPPSRLLSGV